MALPNVTPTQEENEDAASPRQSRLSVWLIILGLALLFVPLFLTSTTIQELTVTLDFERTVVAATLNYTPPPNPTVEALSATLLWVRQQGNTVESLQGTLAAMHINWPSVMAVLGAYDPAQLSILAITQNPDNILVKGQAVDQRVVSAYADMLRESGLFQQVDVGSITIEDVPTATPAPTAEGAPEATAEATAEPPQTVTVFEINLRPQTKAE